MERMKLLFAYDGSACANDAIADLKRAGLPANADLRNELLRRSRPTCCGPFDSCTAVVHEPSHCRGCPNRERPNPAFPESRAGTTATPAGHR